MNPISFVPLMLASLALSYTAFKAKKKHIGWLIISFVVWMLIFIITLWGKKLI